MQMNDTVDLLRRHGIQPSAQRVAIADFVLSTDSHPSADQVLLAVRQRLPVVSRATVYNTLHVLVASGLLRALELSEGRVAYDPKVEPHHHFIDEATGAIRDVPWEALEVRGVEQLRGLQVHEYQVVLRGRQEKQA